MYSPYFLQVTSVAWLAHPVTHQPVDATNHPFLVVNKFIQVHLVFSLVAHPAFKMHVVLLILNISFNQLLHHARFGHVGSIMQWTVALSFIMIGPTPTPNSSPSADNMDADADADDDNGATADDDADEDDDMIEGNDVDVASLLVAAATLLMVACRLRRLRP